MVKQGERRQVAIVVVVVELAGWKSINVINRKGKAGIRVSDSTEVERTKRLPRLISREGHLSDSTRLVQRGDGLSWERCVVCHWR